MGELIWGLWGPFQVTENRNSPVTAGASPDPTDSHLARNPLPDPRMEIAVSRRHQDTEMEGLVLLGFTLQRENLGKKREEFPVGGYLDYIWQGKTDPYFHLLGKSRMSHFPVQPQHPKSRAGSAWKTAQPQIHSRILKAAKI